MASVSVQIFTLWVALLLWSATAVIADKESFKSKYFDFEIDADGLGKFITDTMAIDQRAPIPVALFDTSDTGYACSQISDSMDQDPSIEVNFVRLNNIVQGNDFLMIKKILTQPSLSAVAQSVRTLSFIVTSSDLIPKSAESNIRQKLEELGKLLNQKNQANVRVIFVMESVEGTSNPQSLRTMVAKTILQNRIGEISVLSRIGGASPGDTETSIYSIRDGSYMLKSSSLETVLNDASIKINGRITTLRKIYGDIQPTTANFKPGKKVLFNIKKQNTIISESLDDPGKNCPGGVYIERQFPVWPLAEDRTTRIPTDTPLGIATRIGLDIIFNEMAPTVTVIKGDRGSGKSAAISKIQYIWQGIRPTSWSIRVDLPNLYPATQSAKAMSFDDIVKRVVDPNLSDLFKNLLEINPKKIVFMFDGVDQMTGDRETKIVDIIKSVVEKKAVVVLTGDLRTMELLQMNERLKMIVYNIPELKIHEAKLLLTNIWKEKINNQPSSSSASPSSLKQRLEYYVEHFTDTLYKTSFPRLPSSLIVLAETFAKTSSQGFMGCLDYVFGKSRLSMSFSELLSVSLNKNDLFKKFGNRIIANAPNVKNVEQIYGVALKQIVEKIEGPDKAKKVVAQLHPGPQISDEIIGKLSVHEDLQRFFAAKYIVKSLQGASEFAPIDTLRPLLLNTDYKGVLEFVNDQLKNLQVTKINLFKASDFSSDNADGYRIMNNVIAAGLDNLYCFIYDNVLTISPKNKLTNFYLHKEIEFFKPKRTFGMLRSPLQEKISCTTMCTLVENSMLGALKRLQSTGIWFDKNLKQYTEYYSNMLDVAVTRPTPHIDLVRFLMIHVPTPEFKIDVNSLLVRTISEVGENCQPIATHLVGYRANPQTAQLDGRTILHIAVKWNSENLLRYVVETLGVKTDTPDRYGSTVLGAALDANPSPYYSSTDWWKMMSYLVKKVENLQLPAKSVMDRLSLDKLRIPSNDAHLAWFNLLVSGTSNADIQDTSAKYAIVSKSPTNILSDAELTHFIRYTSSHLPPEILALRRNILLKKLYSQQDVTNVSPLEVIAHYRGVGPLSSTQRQYYEKAIFYLINQKNEVQNREVRNRVIDTIVNNIGETADLKSLEYFIDKGLVRDHADAQRLARRLETRMTARSSTSYSEVEAITMGENLIKSRVHYDPSISGSDLIDEYDNLRTVVNKKNPSIGDDTPDIKSIKTGEIGRCLAVVGGSSGAGCRISWNDIDRFNDATERRSISHIRINTDRFLEAVADIEHTDQKKARQLVDFARQLETRRGIITVLRGRSVMIVRGILEEGGLIRYWRNRHITEIIHDMTTPSSLLRNWKYQVKNVNVKTQISRLFNSETVANHAASSIPWLRGIYASIGECIDLTANVGVKKCLKSTGLFLGSMAVGYIGARAAERLPLLIAEKIENTIQFYSPIIPRAVAASAIDVGTQVVTRAEKVTTVSFEVLGMGFDLYNIIKNSMLLVECSNNPDMPGCSVKNRADMIITMNFSVASIAVSSAVLISGVGALTAALLGIAVFALEILVTGIGHVIYYSVNYNTDARENALIFFRGLIFLPPPADVQGLELRTDWINRIQKQVVERLDRSSDNFVASAVALGYLRNGKLVQGYADIDMNNTAVSHTRGLSRVLPQATDSTTLLCLPQLSQLDDWDKHPNTEPDAVYKCINAFVIGRKRQWKTKSQEMSIIYYDLQYAKEGNIIGSSLANNLFSIYNSSKNFRVVANSEHVTNTFMIQDISFLGFIRIKGKSTHESTIDLQNVRASIFFTWNHEYHESRIQVGRNMSNFFNIITEDKQPNLRFNGRVNKFDTFRCDYHKNYQHVLNDKFVTIDGGGGNSEHGHDSISDCQNTIVRPWSYITGSHVPNVTYVTLVQLQGDNPSTDTTSSITRIAPRQSKFLVMFQGKQFILSRTKSVMYSPTNGTLTWHFWHTDSTTMYLSIEPYRSIQSLPSPRKNSADAIKIDGVQTVFTDAATRSVIFPVINPRGNETDTFAIREFNLAGVVNTTRLPDIYDHFKQIHNHNKLSSNYSLVAKFTDNSTGQIFLFGGNEDDRFFIDGNTTLVVGRNGADVYVFNEMSPQCVYIDNEADDNAVDTLIILHNTCDSLTTSRAPRDNICSDNDSSDNMVLICTVKKGPHTLTKYVQLRKYLHAPQRRHLQIIWNNNVYVPLTYDWNKDQDAFPSNSMGLDTTPNLALYFCFSEDWKASTMTITSRNPYIMLNITDSSNPLIAYRSGRNDLILAKKYLTNPAKSSFVILKDFIVNATSGGLMRADAYEQLRIMIVDNDSDGISRKILRPFNIFLLLSKTQSNHDGADRAHTDLIKEYVFDMSDSDTNKNIIIDRSSISFGTEDYRIGVLKVIGAKPLDFHVKWLDSNDAGHSSLSLCAHKRCVIVTNWCSSPDHRLERINFIHRLDRQPIIMKHLDQLNCDSNNKDKLIKEFNAKFVNAHRRMQLTEEIGDNDEARSMRCLGLTFADHIAGQFIYRMFGFTSIIEQSRFMAENCYHSMIDNYLKGLTHESMSQMLNNTISIFHLSDDKPSKNEEQIMLRIEKSFSDLDSNCWEDFKSSLSNEIYNLNMDPNGIEVKLHWQRQRECLLAKCLGQIPAIIDSSFAGRWR